MRETIIPMVMSFKTTVNIMKKEYDTKTFILSQIHCIIDANKLEFRLCWDQAAVEGICCVAPLEVCHKYDPVPNPCSLNSISRPHRRSSEEKKKMS